MKIDRITQSLMVLGFSVPFLALIFFMPYAAAGTGSLATVSGLVKVNGTVLKTEGAKSAKDVVIYLERVGGHEYPDAPKESAVMDQKGLVFVPHVLPVRKGTSVDFINSDSTDHNVFCVDDCCALVEDINAKKPKFLDLGNFPGGQRASHTFTIPGEAVVLCKLHPEMAAYIIVLETPFFTLAQIDADTQSAHFSIDNVPVGNYILKTWNKKTVSVEQAVTITDGTDVQADITLQKKQRRRRKK